VARQLGVTWIVEGKIDVEGEKFHEAIRALPAGGAGKESSRDLTGDIASLVPMTEGIVGDLIVALGAGAGPRTGAHDRHAPEAMEAYLRGLTLLEGWDVKKNAEKSEEAFREAIAKEPDFAEAHAKLAVALLSRFTRTKDATVIGQAAAAAERAVALSPTLPEAHAAMGLVDLQQGKSAQAVDSFEKALAMAPADDELYRKIARAYAELGRDSEADAMYRRAVDLRPGYWANYNAWGNYCLKKGKLDQAGEHFRKVIDLHPESDVGYLNLAAVDILKGDPREAEPLLQAALKINPNPQAHNNLGTVYYALGRFNDALREWQATEALAKSAMIYSNLGDAYRQLHRSEDAGMAYGKAIELGRAQLVADPIETSIRGMIANALAGSGRCSEAKSEAALALSRSHADPTIAYYAAVASAICHDHDAAVAYTIDAIHGGVVADVKTNPDLAPILGDAEVERAIHPR
jgi:serine/threonine-protein kinase